MSFSVSGIQCPFCHSSYKYESFTDAQGQSYQYSYCNSCDRICEACHKVFRPKIAGEDVAYREHLEEETLKQLLTLNDRLKKHMNYHETHHTESDLP